MGLLEILIGAFVVILVLVIFMFIAALLLAFSMSSEPVLDIEPAYPIVSPDDEAIDGYTPGDKVNSGVFDTIGFPMSDLEYSEDNMIDDIIDEAEKKKNEENSENSDGE